MSWLSDAADAVGGFGKGAVEGAYDGVKGTLEGVGTLAHGAYDLVTSSKARAEAWHAAVSDAQKASGFAATALTDPDKAISEVRQAGSSAWNKAITAYDAAAASGHGSEFMGKLFGQGVVLVGTALIPGGAEADATEGAASTARAAIALDDAGKLTDAAPVLSGGRAAADVVAAGGDAKASQYGVAFFGESGLRYYTPENATIGAAGRSFFLMPLEDSALVTDAASAARYTGMSPSTLAAYKSGGEIYGISFPTDGMALSQPTAADAAGWPHFLEGGHTAVLTGDGPHAGYLVNPTHELVTPGGNPVPAGSVLFHLGPNAEWEQIRKF